MRAPPTATAQLHVATGGRTPEQVADAIATALSGAVRVGTAHPYLVRVGAGTLDSVAGHVPSTARRVALIADEAVTAVAEPRPRALATPGSGGDGVPRRRW